MEMRVRKEQVYETFRMFCKKASKVCVDQVNQAERPLVGGWKLDYQRGKLTFDDTHEFGGYIIIEEEKDSDESYPFGDKHRPAREMVDVMSFCMSMLEILRMDDLVQRQTIPLADGERDSGIMDPEQRMRSRR